MKIRLDILLVNNGLAASREKAKNLIKEGRVSVDGKVITKASFEVDEEADIDVSASEDEFVSRGGYKLLKAIQQFNIDLSNKTCMDIGASTGGFTDCMLKHGAKKVFAIDVGHDQLAEVLLNDERVISLEDTNFRYVTPEDFEEFSEDESGKVTIDFASVDVSFISLKIILPVAYRLLDDGGEMACLIKPQFEAGKERVGKHGVVKEKSVHEDVIKQIISFSKDIGFSVAGLTYSPIKGPEGNIEYLIYIKKSSEESLDVNVKNVVLSAHGELR